MRYRSLSLLLTLLLLVAALPQADAGQDPTAQATAFIAAAFSGDTQAAETMLTDEMLAVLAPQGGLAAIASALNPDGATVPLGEAELREEGGFAIVTIPLALETPQRAQVAVDADGKISGLYFLPAVDDPLVRVARDMLTAAFAGEYETAGAVFSPELTEGLAQSGGLEGMMTQISEAYGRLIDLGHPVRTTSQGMAVVTFPVSFESAQLNIAITFDAQERIAGLIMQPEVEIDWPQLPDGITEEEVQIDAGDGYPLGGTLCLPQDLQPNQPAVLLVAGSGPNGRDEVLGANPVFAQLAYGLAERGIATLRYDKRTFTYPAIQQDPAYTVDMEYTRDVLAAVALLGDDPRLDADRIFIAGHSQGGMLAPRFADAGAEVAGLILMAGTARSLTDLLYDQQMDMLGEVPGATDGLGETYAAMREEAEAVYALPREEAAAHAPLYGGAFPALYLWDMVKYTNAIDLLAQSDLPVLIQQGDNDWQVFPDTDYALYAERLADRPDTTFRLYEGLNHAFMPSEATGLAQAVVEYNAPAEIPAEVMDDLASFVANH